MLHPDIVSIKQGWLWVNNGFISLLSMLDHPFATHDLGLVEFRLGGRDIDLVTLDTLLSWEIFVGGTEIDRDIDW